MKNKVIQAVKDFWVIALVLTAAVAIAFARLNPIIDTAIYLVVMAILLIAYLVRQLWGIQFSEDKERYTNENKKQFWYHLLVVLALGIFWPILAAYVAFVLVTMPFVEAMGKIFDWFGNRAETRRSV